jgi:hypothetical protein
MGKSEEQEGVILANRLRVNNYKFTHIWNESWQRWTKNIIIMMARKKRLWVSKWFPDYCIILKRGALLFIELKKSKWPKGWLNWSVISEEQVEWCNKLSEVPNIQAEICHWAKESIKLINNIENIEI